MQIKSRNVNQNGFKGSKSSRPISTTNLTSSISFHKPHPSMLFPSVRNSLSAVSNVEAQDLVKKLKIMVNLHVYKPPFVVKNISLKHEKRKILKYEKKIFKI